MDGGNEKCITNFSWRMWRKQTTGTQGDKIKMDL
jgi:hypothetical protein